MSAAASVLLTSRFFPKMTKLALIKGSLDNPSFPFFKNKKARAIFMT
jgi:hypothetical protein